MSPPVFRRNLSRRSSNDKIDAVLHFSRRSAENYVNGAKDAGLAAKALAPRQLCLSAQVAEPLRRGRRARYRDRPPSR